MKTTFALLAILAASPLALSAAPYHTEVRSYSVSHDANVNIDANAANVRVEPVDGDQIKLSVSEPTRAEHTAVVDITVARSSKSVSIKALAQDSRYVDAELLVQVPRGAHVTVNNAHGDVAVGRMSAPLSIDAKNGNVLLAQRTANDHVSAKAGRLIVSQGEFANVRGATTRD